jgi:hypothetical protein
MSNTLKFGNGKWAVKEGSTLAYNDENGNFKPLPFTFDRSTSATRVNKQGLIEVVPNNEPRIDFLNDSKGALLLEPARTNLVTNSNDFTSWINSGSYITAEYGISPDGSQNASRCLFTDTNQTLSKIIGTNGTLSYSIYVKGVKGETINISMASGSDNSFTLNGEWQRLSYSNTVTNSTLNINTFGGQTARDLLIFGAQLEQGRYATSYIPTQGATATRLADVNQNQIVPNGIIGQTEGTIYIETDAILSGTTNGNRKGYVHLNDGSYSNRIEITKSGGANINNADDLKIRISVGGVNQFDETIKTDAQGNLKIAFAYKNGDVAAYINGISVFTKTTPTLIPATNNIYIGNAYSNQPISEPILDARLYNTRLSNTELQALTTI